MGCSAAALLNALKQLSGSGGHGVHLIAQPAIEPIQTVKVKYLGSRARAALGSELAEEARAMSTSSLCRRGLDEPRYFTFTVWIGSMAGWARHIQGWVPF